MEISIIIATFNAERTLERCLSSITNQLTNECELIIIDGNSKDNTLGIINKNKQFISCFISESDKGIYDAWNKGIKMAKGNWIMFIGADDVLLPNSISKYLKVIHHKENINTYDYICAYNEHIDKNGKILKIIGGEPKWSIFRRTMNAAHVASLHSKKNLFEEIGGYNLSFKICADYELLMRKKNKLRYIFIPEHIVRMQIGGMSFSTKAILETYKIRKLHNSVPSIINYILFLRDYIAFKLFIFRKKIMGGKF